MRFIIWAYSLYPKAKGFAKHTKPLFEGSEGSGEPEQGPQREYEGRALTKSIPD